MSSLLSKAHSDQDLCFQAVFPSHYVLPSMNNSGLLEQILIGVCWLNTFNKYKIEHTMLSLQTSEHWTNNLHVCVKQVQYLLLIILDSWGWHAQQHISNLLNCHGNIRLYLESCGSVYPTELGYDVMIWQTTTLDQFQTPLVCVV